MTAALGDRYHRLSFENVEEGVAFVAALSRFVMSPAGSSPDLPTASAPAVEVFAAIPLGPHRLDVYLNTAALDATIRGFGRPDVVATCTASELPQSRVLLLGGEDHGAYGRDEIVRRIARAGFDTRIRTSTEDDFATILAIINDASHAYRGVIPMDRWHEPYMPADELEREISEGVVFWVAERDGSLSGVIGLQDKGDVALVRHAYVATTTQRTGVGTRLLRHVETLVDKPILIGTWAAATWAIRFYERNGFTVVPGGDRDRLLRTYWSIPARQIETSVVLARRLPLSVRQPQ